MKASLLICALSAALAAAAATPITETSGTAGGITWTGSVVPGGPKHTFHGTVEEILDQILKLNPSFQKFHPQTPSLYKREDKAPAEIGLQGEPGWTLHCNAEVPGVPRTRMDLIIPAAQYLQTWLGGSTCHAPVGPGTCSMLSCHKGAAIVICNDNPHEVAVPCPRIADLALKIAWGCAAREGGNFGIFMTKGQAFNNNEHWNLMVRDVAWDNGDHCRF